MTRNWKDIKLAFVMSAVMIIAVVIIYFVSQTPQYATDDPLHGSYLVENEEQAEVVHPANFVISIIGGWAVSGGRPNMQEDGVSRSKPWVYCTEEDKFFQAEEEGEKLFIYEGEKQIGTLTYSYKTFLWIHYDESYVMDWRGTKLDLVKIMQAQVFQG